MKVFKRLSWQSVPGAIVFGVILRPRRYEGSGAKHCHPCSRDWCLSETLLRFLEFVGIQDLKHSLESDGRSLGMMRSALLLFHGTDGPPGTFQIHGLCGYLGFRNSIEIQMSANPKKKIDICDDDARSSDRRSA